LLYTAGCRTCAWLSAARYLLCECKSTCSTSAKILALHCWMSSLRLALCSAFLALRVQKYLLYEYKSTCFALLDVELAPGYLQRVTCFARVQKYLLYQYKSTCLAISSGFSMRAVVGFSSQHRGLVNSEVLVLAWLSAAGFQCTSAPPTVPLRLKRAEVGFSSQHRGLVNSEHSLVNSERRRRGTVSPEAASRISSYLEEMKIPRPLDFPPIEV
jgi:hypothetical protein